VRAKPGQRRETHLKLCEREAQEHQSLMLRDLVP
jgi:hypothetical protein